MVSIIIINYNTYRLTADCIRSIHKHTSNVDYEIILVDNASTECEPEKFTAEFPFIHLVKSNKNVGFAGGNNIGITHAKGDEILLLNSDTVLLNDAISITSGKLNENDAAGIITCRMQYEDGRVQHNCQPFPSGLKIWMERMRLHRLLPSSIRSGFMQGHYFDYSKAGKPDWVWGTYMHFRKQMLKDFPNGKLQEDYFMYVEDLQWCFEARKHGWEILYEPSARIIHYSGGSSGPRNEIIHKNFDDFIRRNYSPIKKYLLKTTGVHNP